MHRINKCLLTLNIYICNVSQFVLSDLLQFSVVFFVADVPNISVKFGSLLLSHITVW